jgi:hypothetical protein
VQFEFRDPETERPVSLTNEELWYENLRAEHKPDSVRVLLLAESPPDPGSSDRRFFYNSRLTAHDNLFRSVALAAYGLDKKALQRTPKVETLHRLQADGFFLIDAVGYPINHMEPGARQHAIQEAVPDLIERCRQLAPADGVFICAKPVHKAVTHLLRQANITILNKSPAPFPLGNTRAEFVRLWRRDIPTREAA